MALSEKQRAQTLERQRRFKARQEAARAEELRQKGLPLAPAIPSMPGTARWMALISSARLALETAKDEMESYYEERSEGWQEGDKGEALQGRIEVLDGILSDLDGAE